MRRRNNNAMRSGLCFSRRRVLQILAGAAAGAAYGNPAFAGQTRIDRLIEQTSALPTMSQRIDFISRALIGTPYRGYTLIGGPRSAERMVVRDDAFDCVTFCEAVWAAAMSHKPDDYPSNLRAIRYHNGIVDWFQRNHYFFEWGEHNIENKTCHAISMDGAVPIEKTVYWHRELGRRHFAMNVIPRAVLLANKAALATGDIIGFVTQRQNLDYFHVGLIAFGAKGELLLRHASLALGRVVEENMERFLALYDVRYVTLWRPEEQPATLAARKDN